MPTLRVEPFGLADFRAAARRFAAERHVEPQYAVLDPVTYLTIARELEMIAGNVVRGGEIRVLGVRFVVVPVHYAMLEMVGCPRDEALR